MTKNVLDRHRLDRHVLPCPTARMHMPMASAITVDSRRSSFSLNKRGIYRARSLVEVNINEFLLRYGDTEFDRAQTFLQYLRARKQ